MEQVTIEQATTLSQQDQVAIQELALALSTAADIEQLPPLLQQVMAAEHQVLLLARLEGKVVGMATLTLMVGPVAGRKIYLDDFVTHPQVQGRGVGSKLWQAMLDWGRSVGATKLTFTSNPARQAAHQFYLHKGAVIYDTCVFRKEL